MHRGRRRSLGSIEPSDLPSSRPLLPHTSQQQHQQQQRQQRQQQSEEQHEGEESFDQERSSDTVRESNDSVQTSRSQVDWDSTAGTLQDVSSTGSPLKSTPLRTGASLEEVVVAAPSSSSERQMPAHTKQHHHYEQQTISPTATTTTKKGAHPSSSFRPHHEKGGIQKSALLTDSAPPSPDIDASCTTLNGTTFSPPDDGGVSGNERGGGGGNGDHAEHAQFPEPAPPPIDRFKQPDSLTSLEACFGPFHAAHAHAKKRHRWPFWARIIRDFLLVNLFFMVPAVVLIDQTDLQLSMIWSFPWTDTPEPSWSMQQVMLEVARFLLLVWLILTSSCVSRIIVHFFLKHALVIAEYITGQISDHLKIVVDYTYAVQGYIHFVAGSIALTVGFYILMPYTNNKANFHGTLMLICVCVLVASIMILFEKILIQRLGVNFHAVAYKERLQACNYGLSVIRQLSVAISKKRIPKKMKGIKTVFKHRRAGSRSPVRFQATPFDSPLRSPNDGAEDPFASYDTAGQRTDNEQNEMTTFSPSPSGGLSPMRRSDAFQTDRTNDTNEQERANEAYLTSASMGPRARSEGDVRPERLLSRMAKVSEEEHNPRSSMNAHMQHQHQAQQQQQQDDEGEEGGEREQASPQRSYYNQQQQQQQQQQHQYQPRRGGSGGGSGMKSAASMEFVSYKQQQQQLQHRASFSPIRRSAFSISNEGSNRPYPLSPGGGGRLSASLTSTSPTRSDSLLPPEGATNVTTKTATKTARFRSRAHATDREATRLAKRLYNALLTTGQTQNLTLHNFMPYFSEFELAQNAFDYFDVLRIGEISQDVMASKIQTLFKERLFLSSSFRDMSQVLSNMNRLAMTFTVLVIIFLSVIIMNGSSAITGLYSFSSFFLGLSFVFGDAAKTLFNSCIFVFIVHPFDVGDKITVDGTWFDVVEMNLWTTILCRSDGVQTIATNVYLYAKLICNIRRSAGMSEVIKIDINADTPPSKMLMLQTMLERYLATDGREWLTNTNMNLMIVETSIAGALTLQFSLKHRNNWIDGDRRWHTRNTFIHKLQTYLKELSIEQPKRDTIKSFVVSTS